MNQMQQMLMQAQKMQRDLKKAHDELEAKEFKVTKNGLVEVVLLGDKTIKSIKIEKDALEADNEEMIEETLSLAINEAIAQIKKEEEAIDEKVTGRGGFPF